jgi:hypothetical protein
VSEGGRFDVIFKRSRTDRGESEEGAAATVRPVRRRNRRKTGKRSNPAYRQVTAYIRRDTYELAHYALVGKKNEAGKDLEFSELVDSLLREWAEGEGWTTEDFREPGR